MISSREIHNETASDFSYDTLKRILAQLISERFIESRGTGKATKYYISSTYELFYPIDLMQYFDSKIDQIKIKDKFNLALIKGVLANVKVFTNRELLHLEQLQNEFRRNISQLSKTEYSKELKRLAIDLCWKSSQIEGNTYSLLETEIFVKGGWVLQERIIHLWIMNIKSGKHYWIFANW